MTEPSFLVARMTLTRFASRHRGRAGPTLTRRRPSHDPSRGPSVRTWRWLCRLLAATMVVASASSLPAQSAPAATTTPAQSAEPGSELTIYLLTMGPGDEVWERFGHNAIWVRDRARHTDIAYNWGMFDFEQPNFIPRFLAGRMLYWMAGYDTPRTIESYIAVNRSVSAQELRLTPAQRVALRDFVEWNARDENKYYHYDYYRDNCSTRVRDAIDRVLGGSIRRASANVPTGTTYRSHTQRLTAGDVPVYTGIMIILGHPADRPISAWQEMFLPAKLHDHLRHVTVPDASGRQVPLVASEWPLFVAKRPPEPAAPPRDTLYYLLAGLVVAALLVALSVGTARGSRGARAGLAVVGGAWSLLAGLAGTAILIAWTLTEHVFMRRNENVLQLNPLSLALVVLLPLLLYRGRASRAVAWLGTAIAALAVLGFAIQVLPWFHQVNGEIIALALPVQVAMAWAVRRSATAPRAGSAIIPGINSSTRA